MHTIEELLATAAGEPDGPAWGELYQEVCHQGTCYPEGFFLVPRLAEIAAGFAPADRDQVLVFAGQIAVDLDPGSRERYATDLAALRELTGPWLATPTEPGMFLYRLQAVLALEGDPVWGRELDRISDGEVEVECPTCTTSLYVVFGAAGHFASHEDYATEADVERTPLLPAAPGDLEGVGARLHAMCLTAGRAGLAEELTYLFGRAVCTQCATTFRVSERIGPS